MKHCHCRTNKRSQNGIAGGEEKNGNIHGTLSERSIATTQFQRLLEKVVEVMKWVRHLAQKHTNHCRLMPRADNASRCHVKDSHDVMNKEHKVIVGDLEIVG